MKWLRRRGGRRRRVLLTMAGAAMAWIGPAATSQAWASTSPINPSNSPTPIPGATNGEVPSSDLVTVAPNCSTARAAGPSLGLLLAEARERGVVLGTEQCYRSLQEQEQEQQIWTGKGNSACAAAIQTTPNGTPVGTSMHGWGKAADFYGAGGELAFGTDAYRFLAAYAGGAGWNHPGWAEPGGSACPEAWHWEWVGDGGTQQGTPIAADVVGGLPSGDDYGYATISGLGAVGGREDFAGHGDASGVSISWLVAGGAASNREGGYWLVGADGGVFSYGNAPFHGSMGGRPLAAPVVGMAATPSGQGYWLVAADGGVFSFGDARFYGSMGGHQLDRPVVGMAASPSGHGYWLVGADGGVFSFGDARFAGSMGGHPLNAPVVGTVAGRSGGYWLLGADGGVFSFGVPFLGSAPGAGAQPAVGMIPTPTGGGYRVTFADGRVVSFGDAR